MPTFDVTMKEVHDQVMRIVADDKESAIERVADGDGTELCESEYHHTLDKEVWNCEEVNG